MFSPTPLVFLFLKMFLLFHICFIVSTCFGENCEFFIFSGRVPKNSLMFIGLRNMLCFDKSKNGVKLRNAANDGAAVP